MKRKKENIVIGILTLLLALLSFLWLWRVADPDLNYKNIKPSIVKTPPSLVKIGFVTDWEYGTKKLIQRKVSRQAPMKLANSVFYLNETFRPDLVVGGGDYVESSTAKPEDAKSQLESINEIFSLLKAPRLYAFGNHDFRALTQEEVHSAIGVPENHAIQDIGDWRVIILDTNFDERGLSRNAKGYVTGGVNQEELQWLEDALETDRPVLVFCHHSPVPVPYNGMSPVLNIYNAPAVRKVLEANGNVAAVFSGHNPTSYYTELDGINYFVADTLVNQSAMGSFVTIEVQYDSQNRSANINYTQFGPKEIDYSINWQYGQKVIDEQKLKSEGREEKLTEDE